MAEKKYERRGGGSRKGIPNKDKDDVLTKLAKKHAKDAIRELAVQMKTAPEKAVRVSAAKEILDRAFGKATQKVGGDAGNPIIVKIDKGDAGL